jgi:N6-L-threonylcarbamoyladenine synthase
LRKLKSKRYRNPMLILGIETSCDETSAAVVANGTEVLSNVISSQVELHREHGGVVPELASRQHIRLIPEVVSRALRIAGTSLEEVQAVAVTHGPGLAGALLVGVNFAKALALATGKPLLGVNHLEGHIYSTWLNYPIDPLWQPPELPILVLIVSGGHTQLVLMDAHLSYRTIGRTQDDAAGEAFDKVARLLGLGYPGGPAIQRLAEEGNPDAYPMPRAYLANPYDFSFSGLKTAVLRLVLALQGKDFKHPDKLARVTSTPPQLPRQVLADVAASFQKAVVDMLVWPTVEAASKLNVREIHIVGGVAANRLLRSRMQESWPVVRVPHFQLCTDNGAMIAAAGYRLWEAGVRSTLELDLEPNLPLRSNFQG